MARLGRAQPFPPIVGHGRVPESSPALEFLPRAIIVHAPRIRQVPSLIVTTHGPVPESAPAIDFRPQSLIVSAVRHPHFAGRAVLGHGPIPEQAAVLPPRPSIVLSPRVPERHTQTIATHGPVPGVAFVRPPAATSVLVVYARPVIHPPILVHGPIPTSPVAVAPVIARFTAQRRIKWTAHERKTWTSQRRVTWRRGKGTMTKTLSGFKELDQATTETKDYVYDTSEYLPSTVSVSSATATLTSPSGGTQAITPTYSNNSGGVQAIVTTRVTIAHLGGVTGLWKLDVKPSLSNGEIAPQVRFEINVPY